ncbi:MAG: triphosphoribosyl-dephospho-CoA synthase [Gammaproteobacteria bacterium]|nr:triphosphoribosyl-dephospho-CoA synthase [Gammaproteobacteria bacterium]
MRKHIQTAWITACELDILAYKPGNVSVYSAGHEMTADQFRVSAQVCVDPITDFTLSLGEKIFYSIQNTRSAVSCNTNLGIVLLCAPLVQALQSSQQACGINELHQALNRVLDSTTVCDTNWVYQAIRAAKPGGMGKSEKHDITDAPDVTLKAAMQEAIQRDRIAYQYCSGYSDIFEFGIPRFRDYCQRLTDKRWATLAVFTDFLLSIPDSLITRKYGDRFNAIVAEKMTLIQQQLEAYNPVAPEPLFTVLETVDDEFKQLGINPGTTADLTVATVFADELVNKAKMND